MKNKHIVVVVDDTLAVVGEFSNYMYERSGSTRRVEPGLAQIDGFEQLRFFVFDEKDLKDVSARRLKGNSKADLFWQLIATLRSIGAFIDSFDKVALDRSRILLTLHELVLLFIRQQVRHLRTVVMGACVAATSAAANSSASMSSPKSSSSSTKSMTGGPAAVAVSVLA